MDFSGFLAWLMQMGVVGLVLVCLQEILKALGFDPVLATPRAAAVVVAVVVGVVVGAVQFGWGIIIFPEISTLYDLLEALLTWIAAGQAIYQLLYVPVKRRIFASR
ncbi:MAG: hypothetical protein A2Z04_06640 [Chloroflexi bacterium RBG_16_57_9]|nr:MAG: hypothetical protein A2Z04_06640 [Chloroflexi bacterium RBG_16_57_9]